MSPTISPPVALDSWAYNPAGFLPGYTAPTTNTSTTGSFNDYSAPGFDWGSNITKWLQLAPNVIAASRGNPYGSGRYGQGSYPSADPGAGGQGVYAGGSFLGASGFGNISGTTLLLIGLAAFMLLRRK